MEKERVYKFRVKFKRKPTDVYEHRYFMSRGEALEFMYDLMYNNRFSCIVYKEYMM